MSNPTALAPAAGTTVREGLSGTEITQAAETSAEAVAAQAKAKIEAHFVLAYKNPRKLLVARQRLLDACTRPRFAAVALYKKPIGGDHVTGPSIRFAEEAIRALGNVLCETMVVYDDPKRRIVRVSVTDLETNIPFTEEVVIEKTVERNRVGEGQTVLRQRRNSKGGIVYVVEATEDDLAVKQAARVSKALRTLALRILPGDIMEDALDEIRATLNKRNAENPTARAKKLADDFYLNLRIGADELARYLGKDVSQATASELTDLEVVLSSINDGATTWAEVMAAREATEAKPAPAAAPAGPPPPPPPTRTDAVLQAAKAKKGAKSAPAAQQTIEPQEREVGRSPGGGISYVDTDPHGPPDDVNLDPPEPGSDG